MDRREVEIEVASIVIDERKAAYIATKGVKTTDVTEVFENQPRFFEEVKDDRSRYSMLGPNGSGRFLLVAIAHVEDAEWRLISAYWLRANRGRRLYEGE